MNQFPALLIYLEIIFFKRRFRTKRFFALILCFFLYFTLLNFKAIKTQNSIQLFQSELNKCLAIKASINLNRRLFGKILSTFLVSSILLSCHGPRKSVSSYSAENWVE